MVLFNYPIITIITFLRESRVGILQKRSVLGSGLWHSAAAELIHILRFALFFCFNMHTSMCAVSFHSPFLLRWISAKRTNGLNCLFAPVQCLWLRAINAQVHGNVHCAIMLSIIYHCRLPRRRSDGIKQIRSTFVCNRGQGTSKSNTKANKNAFFALIFALVPHIADEGREPFGIIVSSGRSKCMDEQTLESANACRSFTNLVTSGCTREHPATAKMKRKRQRIKWMWTRTCCTQCTHTHTHDTEWKTSQSANRNYYCHLSAHSDRLRFLILTFIDIFVYLSQSGASKTLVFRSK